VLFIDDGDQVPETPLVDVTGNAAKGAPEQIDATCVNVGTTKGFTTISIVVVLAHVPTVGVNVYIVVDVLFNDGDQVPETPLFEVVGNADNDAPAQIAAT